MINWIRRHLSSMTQSKQQEVEEEIKGPKYMGMMMGFNDSCELFKKKENKRKATKDAELELLSRTERLDSTGAPEVSLQPINLILKDQPKKQPELIKQSTQEQSRVA